MNLIPFILLLVGMILIFLEFFFPGGILAIAAGVLLLVSIVIFAMQSSSFLWTLLYTAGIVIVVSVLIKFTISKIRQGKFKGIYLSSAQNGYMASEFSKELIGKRGEAISDLKPAGHILVEGKRYQAVAKAGYIEKGARIEVIGGEGAHLIIKEIKDPSNA